ncbi:hypothetical protein [Fodinibius salinus]|nr:hypothetical protein [Fodinibius salinus]
MNTKQHPVYELPATNINQRMGHKHGTTIARNGYIDQHYSFKQLSSYSTAEI